MDIVLVSTWANVFWWSLVMKPVSLFLSERTTFFLSSFYFSSSIDGHQGEDILCWFLSLSL
jgi:hypothetical protein